jgi:hypothetical protein
MFNAARKDRDNRNIGAPEWIWEVLIIVTIAPGIVYGFLSLGGLPVT